MFVDAAKSFSRKGVLNERDWGKAVEQILLIVKNRKPEVAGPRGRALPRHPNPIDSLHHSLAKSAMPRFDLRQDDGTLEKCSRSSAALGNGLPLAVRVIGTISSIFSFVHNG